MSAAVMSDMGTPKLGDLVNELYEVKAKWKTIGRKLNVPESTLDTIERESRNDIGEALTRMLHEWKREDSETSWREIVNALRSKSVKEYKLAKDLEVSRCPLPPDDGDSAVSIEEAELIVKQALENEGSRVKQKNLVVVITGLMEAGKSTLLNRLFGKSPPGKYTSTGVSEGPWRGLTRDTLDIKKFKRLSVKDIFKSVAPLLQRLQDTRANESDIEETDTGNVDMHQHQEDGVAIVQSLEETHSSGEAYAIKEMARYVRNEPQDYTLEIAFIVDTGGQPECLEVLPTVLHNTNLEILVVDLSRSLDANPKPTMHKKDCKYGKRVPLLCSNRQIIEQTAHTISGRTNSSLLVVGSHADCKWNDSVVSDMNEHLKAVIPKDSCYHTAKHHSIFTVDLKHYDTDNDKETIEQIRTCIGAHETEEIPLPPSFVMFEYQVMEYFENELAETRKVGVMTFQECVDIGKELKMEKEKVEAALQYFHKNNIFLFFSHKLVFLRPQALLNFVNTIVSLSYKISNKEKICPPLKAQQIDDLSNGIITEELLKHRYIADNLVTGVFEASHAIKIFKDLHTMAKQGEGKYIMMCLLPRLERKVFEEKEQSLIRECTLAEPLVLHFGKYCAPNGCFGNTIACLMSRKRYKIEYTDLNEETPECLTHDIVTLRPYRKRFKVTLVNKTKHFTVYVHLKKDKTCVPVVRDEIVSAVRDVLKTMHIDKTKVDVNEGFKCSKCSKIIPLPNTEEETLYCEGHHEELPLEPKYFVWSRDEKDRGVKRAAHPPEKLPSDLVQSMGDKDKLMRDYNLTEDMLKIRCSKDHIYKIEQFISWAEVGRHLPRIESVKLSDMIVDGRTEPQRRQWLMALWEERNADEATYDVLIDAMIKAQKLDEATNVCKLLRPDRPPPPKPPSSDVQPPTAGGETSSTPTGASPAH